MDWYIGVLKKYAEFNGRARRKEFWMFALINTVIGMLLGGIGGALDIPVIANIYSLAVLIPTVAVSVRRLHDIGRTGWWVLISFVPIIGFLVLLFFCASEGDPTTNIYGHNPKDANLFAK